MKPRIGPGHPVWVFVALAATIVAACTAEQLREAKSAAGEAGNKRETICRFVQAWAPDMPELEEARAACEAGKDLKEVAAAYAGCSSPE